VKRYNKFIIAPPWKVICKRTIPFQELPLQVRRRRRRGEQGERQEEEVVQAAEKPERADQGQERLAKVSVGQGALDADGGGQVWRTACAAAAAILCSATGADDDGKSGTKYARLLNFTLRTVFFELPIVLVKERTGHRISEMSCYGILRSCLLQ
jgi:hypothetical protein